MPRRSGLGRGLDALIPSQPDAGDQPDPSTELGETAAPAGEEPPSALRTLPLTSIHPNRYQPRVAFADDEMVELTESVRELGVLQPLLVRPDPAGGYELIAGERRWRAAQAAGLTEVPVVVRPTGDREALEQALVENLQRADLDAMEEAVAYQQLIDEFGLTQDGVATRVGKHRSSVANTLRLLSLPGEVQELVRSRQLSAGHARAIAALEDAERQRQLARRAVQEGWSVRAMEQAVQHDPPVRSAVAVPAARSAAALELEQLLADHLDTKVVVKVPARGSRGTITVHFAGLDDLERIYRAMTAGRPSED